MYFWNLFDAAAVTVQGKTDESRGKSHVQTFKIIFNTNRTAVIYPAQHSTPASRRWSFLEHSSDFARGKNAWFCTFMSGNCTSPFNGLVFRVIPLTLVISSWYFHSEEPNVIILKLNEGYFATVAQVVQWVVSWSEGWGSNLISLWQRLSLCPWANVVCEWRVVDGGRGWWHTQSAPGQ